MHAFEPAERRMTVAAKHLGHDGHDIPSWRRQECAQVPDFESSWRLNFTN